MIEHKHCSKCGRVTQHEVVGEAITFHYCIECSIRNDMEYAARRGLL